MFKKITVLTVLVCVALIFSACGGKGAPQPGNAATPAAQPAAQPVASQSPAVEIKSGMHKIGDLSDAWSALYKQNEEVVNKYDGMPIMELVTPPLTFIASVQYDMMNLGNKEGRFEGKLMLAGYNGFVEKKGAQITFGYDHTLEKNGFGPAAKAGDKMLQSGSVDLEKEFYCAETSTERAGKKISRNYTEFKRLADGSMICIDFDGHTIDIRGEHALSDEVIYLHNGKGQYDFVIGKAKSGPDFKLISFAEKGDLTKEQAIELFKAAGYTLDKVGGIKDGKLVLDK